MVALDEEQRSLLAAAVKRRQRELRVTQREIADRARLSLSVYNRIVNARADSISEATLDAIDDGLGWQRGSAERVIAGGDPLESSAPLVVVDERVWTDSRGRVWTELAERGARLDPQQEQAITDAVERLLDGYGV